MQPAKNTKGYIYEEETQTERAWLYHHRRRYQDLGVKGLLILVKRLETFKLCCIFEFRSENQDYLLL